MLLILLFVLCATEYKKIFTFHCRDSSNFHINAVTRIVRPNRSINIWFTNFTDFFSLGRHLFKRLSLLKFIAIGLMTCLIFFCILLNATIYVGSKRCENPQSFSNGEYRLLIYFKAIADRIYIYIYIYMYIYVYIYIYVKNCFIFQMFS